jgi:flagellar motor switch protein FliM
MQEPRPSPAKRRRADPLLEGAGLAAERLAGLRGSFERLAGRCAEDLRQLSPSPIEIGLKDLAPGGEGDVLAAYGEIAPVAVYHAPDRISRIVIGADLACMELALDAVFGADGSEPPSDRRYAGTSIELRLAGAIFDLIADSLRGAFAGTVAAPIERERLEPMEKLPAAVRGSDVAIFATFALTALERGGEVYVLLPQAALPGLQQSASPPASPASNPRDPRWSRRIEQEVQRTQVSLQAVLDEQKLTLGDVAEFRVGQMLSLRAGPRSQVKMVCNDQTLFWCELGQTDGAYTLRVKDFPDQEQELIDAIFSK